ncbi:hypothetical protein, partial [Deinococcus metalli]
VSQATRLPIQSVEFMEMLDGMAQEYAADSVQAVQAAIDFEKALLSVAQSSAVQAIPIDGQSEAERVEAAERQIKLIGRLFQELQGLTQPAER